MIAYRKRKTRTPRPALTLAEFIAAGSSAPRRTLRQGESVNLSALARQR